MDEDKSGDTGLTESQGGDLNNTRTPGGASSESRVPVSGAREPVGGDVQNRSVTGHKGETRGEVGTAGGLRRGSKRERVSQVDGGVGGWKEVHFCGKQRWASLAALATSADIPDRKD